jgi:hypothetical protein
VRGGRYRSVRVAKWGDPDFKRLSPDARLLLLALITGSSSSLAGIGHAYTEALADETGLSSAQIEAAYGELEKKPTPARSFVVREGSVVWVRDALADDPSRGEDPDVRNPKHLTAIETILGSLPRGLGVVRKFRAYYKLDRHTVSRPVPDPVSDTSSHSRIRIPNPNPNPETKTTPKKESARGNSVTLSSLSEPRNGNGHDPTNNAFKGNDQDPSLDVLPATGRQGLADVRVPEHIERQIRSHYRSSRNEWQDIRWAMGQWLEGVHNGAIDPAAEWVP